MAAPSIFVLHVAQPLDAGVPQYVVDVATRLAVQGCRVEVAAPEPSVVHGRLAAAGVPTQVWEATREPGVGLPLEIAALRRVVERTQPDLVHLHAAKAGLCGRLLIRGRRPTVFQPHAWSFEAARGPVQVAALAWERFAARWSDALVCVSDGEREAGLTSAIVADWHVIPNGVDLATWRVASPHERDTARSRLPDPTAPTVVCVGRLSRQKGQDVLLDAWPAIERRVPQARLVLVGDGPERHPLEARAAATVHLVGASSDVSGWLAAADVVVVPSRWEGMSLAMLEAMARGRAVVATDVAGAREAIGTEAGAVVPIDDAPALASAIAKRLNDPDLTRREGQAGRRKVEGLYNLDRVVDSLMTLYRDLLDAP